ncbi:hypothetical protein [Nocardioides insulae]|uniref:hypothetical protein n=1 Tax=Nocardioides insulae TaxID=394734 RepID=UPI0012F9BFD3|nr:hypothetical protein [Nocardioides insulae]
MHRAEYGVSMFGRRRPTQPSEDPAVAFIEALLDRASTTHPAGAWQGRARHALTICACVTPDHSPDWIIFDTEEGIGWRRWPDDLPDIEVVHAPLEAGGHADPSEVLAWLQCTAEDPWGAGGDGSGDADVLTELQRWIAIS